MIIVGEALRGRGLGRRLVEGLMAEADIPEYRLIATEAGLPLYRKLGFLETGRIRQHQGQVTPLPTAPVDWASAADHAALCALDRQATGMDRAP
ncbi:GNAT family N-acetyltransferase (plasmid) [Paracoccus marcusii]|uniref:GNAT family N-acetyltransferase n=1 Tax=Paracoccus marcusii TaxID=59779 RepID=UPI002ED355A6|nr:GNAT family N-acetyltransferase [Paracoccus marcusii]